MPHIKIPPDTTTVWGIYFRDYAIDGEVNGTGFCNCPLLFSLGISVCPVGFTAAITRKMVVLYKFRKENL